MNGKKLKICKIARDNRKNKRMRTPYCKVCGNEYTPMKEFDEDGNVCSWAKDCECEEPKSSGDFGEIIAEIRNKFSPILNYFTLKDEKIQGLISEGMAKKELELILAKDLHSKIKELLDRLG